MSKVQNVDGRKSKRQKLEDWLSERYFLRYNEIKYTVEFAKIQRKKPLEWENLTDRVMNTMLREIDKNTDLNININFLYSVLTSDFSKSYNPIIDYFENLHFEPYEESHIEKLSDCVQLKHKEHKSIFKKVLRSWLISSVANSLNLTGCQNQTCLTLTGIRGANKTTFFNSICPNDLKQYMYSGSLDLKSKDTWIMLGQNFLICIDDQLDNLFKGDAETMKTLITSKENKRRLPHAKFVTDIPRIANFCGTLNHAEFLRDTTGNRRFLPFEVSEIWINELIKYVDIDKVWFEALQGYKEYLKDNSKKYWFTRQELDEMFGGFDDFYVKSPEEELLLTYFELCTNKERLTSKFKKLMPSEIAGRISEIQKSMKLSIRVVSQILQKYNCEKSTRTGGQRCYLVREKELHEIERDQEVEQPEHLF